MPSGRFVAYYRVSTQRQGRSGLGLEAQQDAVRTFLNGSSWTLVAELTEVESGKNDDRPKLNDALRLCRIHAAVLVIAKLDRLSRDAAFLLNLQKAGVSFVATDMPDANEMTVQMMAVIAQHERKQISSRTAAALCAAKLRGIKLGGYRPGALPNAEQGRKLGCAAYHRKALRRALDLLPIVHTIQQTGEMNLHQLADALNARSIPAARGGRWSAVQIMRLLEYGRAYEKARMTEAAQASVPGS